MVVSRWKLVIGRQDSPVGRNANGERPTTVD